MKPDDFEDCFDDQPARPALAEDLQRVQWRRGRVLRRWAWAGGLTTAVGVTATAVVVSLAGPATTQTAVPVAPASRPAPTSGPSVAPTPTDEPTGDYPTREQIAAQQRVDEALRPIWKVVKNDGGDDPHYASASVSVEDQTATIYWKGAVPKVIRDLEGTTATGVRVSVVPAAYSQHDARAAEHELFAANGRGDLPEIKGAGLSSTGDGLSVGFSRTDLDRYGEEELARQVRSVIDMPVRLNEGHDFDTGVGVLPGYAPVSDAALAALRSQGTELTLVDPDRPSDPAVKAAGGSSTHQPAGLSMARATLEGVTGVRKDTTSNGKLLIHDRLVWVVVFDNVRQTVSGPGENYAGKLPSSYVANLAVIVDAATNKFLHAETF